MEPSHGLTRHGIQTPDDGLVQHPNGYSLKSPEGSVFAFADLTTFVAEHPELFTPQLLNCENGEELSAAARGLASLAPWSQERQTSWQGWTWHEENPPLPSLPPLKPPREYSFRAPSGEIFKTGNVRQFTQAHRHLFEPQDFECYKDSPMPKAARGLLSLSPWKKHRQKAWHGWTWYDENNPSPPLRPPREYSLRSPEGEIFKTNNLQRFVFNNPNLFTPQSLEIGKGEKRPKAVGGLLRLTPWRKARPQQSWLGWTWYDENVPLPPLPPLRPPKEYSFRAPNGEIFKPIHFRQFIKTHRHLFEPEDFKFYKGSTLPKVAGGLLALAPWKKYRQRSWHGWTWYDENNPSPLPREYSIRSPDGKIFKTGNLRGFIAKNIKLFTPPSGEFGKDANTLRIAGGLAAIVPWRKTAKPIKSWYGWTWYDENSPPPPPPKKYVLKSPGGEIFKTTNLRKFVVEHRALFKDEDVERGKDSNRPKAVIGLSTLAPWRQSRMRSWHGWTWHNKRNPPPPPREYALKSPDGEVFKTTNLQQFIVEHWGLFEPQNGDPIEGTDKQRVAHGLSLLAPWRQKTKRVKSWRGWTWHDESNPLLP